MTSAEESASLPVWRLALVRERGAERPADRLSEPTTAAHWLATHTELGDSPQETMLAVSLDSRSRPIGVQVAARGTIDRCVFSPRDILAAALLSGAHSVLLAHNHPSGHPSPSAEDIAVTRRLATACEVVGLELRDHIIIGEDGAWVSLQRRGAW